MKDLVESGVAINVIDGSITILELVKQINLFRLDEGNRSELQHSDLLKIIRDEFSDEIGIGKISEPPYTHPQNGQVYPMFVLRRKNVLMDNNVPYQRYQDMGLFRVIEQKFMKNGEPCINIKTFVYQNGVDYVRNLIDKKI